MNSPKFGPLPENLPDIPYGLRGFNPDSKRLNCFGMAAKLLELGGFTVVGSSIVPGVPAHAFNLFLKEGEDTPVAVNFSPRRGLHRLDVDELYLPESTQIPNNLRPTDYLLMALRERNTKYFIHLAGEEKPRKVFDVFSNTL